MHQKSGKINENSSKNSQNNRNNGDSGSDCERIKDESDKGMRNRAGKENVCEGFDRNLTGIQFSPMNGMVENRDEDIEGKKGCLGNGSNCKNDNAKSDDCVEVGNEGDDSSNNEFEMEFNDKDEEVVKKENVSSQYNGSKETNISAEKSLADIVKSNRLHNKYHIRRMWYRSGLRDVIPENGVFYFKFQNEGWIKEVINNGLWMMNNKPLVVKKWSIDMYMDKTKLKRILVWVKIRNVPMKAWSVKGISALASSIGKPIIMNKITTRMYVTEVGRIGFARVLVEIDAKKGIKDKIEIMYKSKSITERTKKIMDVEYSWIPCICSQCKVFGHTDNVCKSKSKNGTDDGSVKTNDNEFKVMQNGKYGREGFDMNRKLNTQNGQFDRMRNEWRNVRKNNQWQTNNKFEYRRRKGDKRKGKGLDDNEGIDVEDDGLKTSNKQASGGSRNIKDTEKENQQGSTSVDNSNRNGILSKKNDDNNVGMNGWTKEMKRYYRDIKELFNAAKEIKRNKDVMEEDCDEGSNVLKNEVEGAWLISQSRQYMFLLMETIDKKSKFFCTMIYASNSEMERRKLWKDLEMQKIITNGQPWIILDDFNVTLKMDGRQDIFTNRIKPEEALRMVRPISDSEIKNAMFEIKDSKAPGLDGYTSRFYKSAWSIIEKEVCQAVREFFLTGKLLGEVNATLITLVPKIPTPDKIYDFRPIACCNVLYKCISELTKGKAKVSWDAVCKPKDQGGLGLKNLGVWNEVLMIKHLWNVAVKKDTLWVKWIYIENLKERSIWEAQCDNKFSVGWKNILSLRDKVRKHIWWKLGNRKLSNQCIVNEIIHEGRWKWLADWSTDFVEMGQIQVPILRDDIEDTAVWISGNGHEKNFKISNVWKDMNWNETKVEWHRLVWFTQSIPRHAFVTWLAIQKRQMT
nr:hypothetical protein [Tanacetum cinerariifolium]